MITEKTHTYSKDYGAREEEVWEMGGRAGCDGARVSTGAWSEEGAGSPW